jgi:hypothetical protein
MAVKIYHESSTRFCFVNDKTGFGSLYYDLDKNVNPHLRALAKAFGIKNFNKIKKNDLVTMLNEKMKHVRVIYDEGEDVGKEN